MVEYSLLNKNTTDHALAWDVKKKICSKIVYKWKIIQNFNNGHILGTLFHTCICYMPERGCDTKEYKLSKMSTNDEKLLLIYHSRLTEDKLWMEPQHIMANNEQRRSREK